MAEEPKIAGAQLQEVVIVDADDADRTATQRLLLDTGIADLVLAFRTGDDALDYLQRPEGHEVDLLLVAVDPATAPLSEVLLGHERLHSSQRARAVAVLRPASSAPTVRAELAPGGARHCLVKPLDAAQARALADFIARTLSSGWP